MPLSRFPRSVFFWFDGFTSATVVSLSTCFRGRRRYRYVVCLINCRRLASATRRWRSENGEGSRHTSAHAPSDPYRVPGNTTAVAGPVPGDYCAFAGSVPVASRRTGRRWLYGSPARFFPRFPRNHICTAFCNRRGRARSRPPSERRSRNQ